MPTVRRSAMPHKLVLDFWFEELTPQQHWAKDPALDQYIRDNFGDYHHAASQGELCSWRRTAEGRLAEIILLDQFSRNIYRDSAQSFAYDGMALVLAQEAVAQAYDRELDLFKRSFIYMPYMHSESLLIHERALLLFNQEGLENNLEFERRHKVIIERFGRYPHRNALLGRESSAEELEFLQQPGSSF